MPAIPNLISFLQWKGYTEADDTWEKKESFGLTDKLSDSIRSTNLSLKTFWDNTNVGGRDVDDLDQFKIGEQFERQEEIKIPKRPTARKRTGGKPPAPVPRREPSVEIEMEPSEPNPGKRKQVSSEDALDTDPEDMHERKSQCTRTMHKTCSKPQQKRTMMTRECQCPKSPVIRSPLMATPIHESPIDIVRFLSRGNPVSQPYPTAKGNERLASVPSLLNQ